MTRNTPANFQVRNFVSFGNTLNGELLIADTTFGSSFSLYNVVLPRTSVIYTYNKVPIFLPVFRLPKEYLKYVSGLNEYSQKWVILNVFGIHLTQPRSANVTAY